VQSSKQCAMIPIRVQFVSLLKKPPTLTFAQNLLICRESRISYGSYGLSNDSKSTNTKSIGKSATSIILTSNNKKTECQSTRGYVRQTAKKMSVTAKKEMGNANVNTGVKQNSPGKNLPKYLEERNKYLKMQLSAKRQEYACGDEYVTLDMIKTWPQYAQLEKTLPAKPPLPKDFQLNPKLNDLLSTKVSLFRGDITTIEIDAIVNAANRTLLGGGGVDGAIHRAAGPNLVEENKTHIKCEVGEAKLSGGYKLPAKYVISTVGPQGEKPNLLQKCYQNSLMVLRQNSLKSIAFPCISTGIYGYPVRPAAHVAVSTVRTHLEKYPHDVDRVVFCLFSEIDEEIYKEVLQCYFPLV